MAFYFGTSHGSNGGDSSSGGSGDGGGHRGPDDMHVLYICSIP